MSKTIQPSVDVLLMSTGRRFAIALAIGYLLFTLIMVVYGLGCAFGLATWDGLFVAYAAMVCVAVSAMLFMF
jgi:hypothetical protein